MISDCFWYFGRDAIQLPKEFEKLTAHRRPAKAEKNPEVIESLVDWIAQKYENRINGTPFSWKHDKGFKRYQGV